MSEQLLDFESELDLYPETRRIVRASTVVPRVTERVLVHQGGRPPEIEEKQTYLTKTDEQWDWQDLQRYVIVQSQQRFGVFPRDTNKEIGIFKGFIRRHGAAEAAKIARYVFQIENGRWRGAPVKVSRFCEASDPYFARVILDYLAKNS